MNQHTFFSTIANSLFQKLQAEAHQLVAPESLHSTRAVGDTLERFVAQQLKSCIPQETLGVYEDDFTRRSMEDIAFSDQAGNYYAIDVKTHHTGTMFNMPNLISVKRLAAFYRNPINTFCLLMIKYSIVDERISFQDCLLLPIEQLDWSCLTLGALGWGQIQIRNSNDLQILPQPSRRNWMLHLCDAVAHFYDVEISKIDERRTWFYQERQYWATLD